MPPGRQNRRQGGGGGAAGRTTLTPVLSPYYCERVHRVLTKSTTGRQASLQNLYEVLSATNERENRRQTYCLFRSGRWNAEGETDNDQSRCSSPIMVEQPHSSDPTEIQLPCAVTNAPEAKRSARGGGVRPVQRRERWSRRPFRVAFESCGFHGLSGPASRIAETIIWPICFSNC